MPKKCKIKRFYALSGGWTITGIAKKSAKNNRVDALIGRWTMIGTAKKKVQK